MTKRRLGCTLGVTAAALWIAGLGDAPVGAASPVALFDGKSLGGWYTFLDGVGKNKDPNGVFKIENGTIHVSGQTFGYLSTEKEYENFRLSVDFKWGEKKWPPRENVVRDAGVLYAVNGPDQVWSQCLELQVQEGDTGDLWLIPGMVEAPSVEVIGQTLGGTKAYTRGVKFADHEKPHGQWNTVQVVTRPGRIEHWVNGRVNMIGKRPSLSRGRIQLQSEGAEIYYRNVTLESF
jgi:hypothetical protein